MIGYFMFTILTNLNCSASKQSPNLGAKGFTSETKNDIKDVAKKAGEEIKETAKEVEDEAQSTWKRIKNKINNNKMTSAVLAGIIAAIFTVAVIKYKDNGVDAELSDFEEEITEQSYEKPANSVRKVKTEEKIVETTSAQ
jgi:Zn-dependent M32 family carboxypeptidase